MGMVSGSYEVRPAGGADRALQRSAEEERGETGQVIDAPRPRGWTAGRRVVGELPMVDPAPAGMVRTRPRVTSCSAS